MRTHRKFVATYIMANKRNGTLYTGVAANLPARVWKHRVGAFDRILVIGEMSRRPAELRIAWYSRS